jgi:transporter family protein
MRGELLALTAALMWGLAPLLDRVAIVNTTPFVANFFRASGAFTVLLIYALLSGGLKEAMNLDIKSISFFVLAGIMAGAIAVLAYYQALKFIGAGRTVPLTSIYPLVTVVFAAMLLGERLTLTTYLGAVLIVAGVILIGIE